VTNITLPRYRKIADKLRDRIQSGALGPGAALPTEMELCEQEGISRHTAREALRLLRDEGLITRKRGAGTIVAETPPPVFAQPLGDFESILQYARNASLVVRHSRPATRADSARFGLSGPYTVLTGHRGIAGKPPVALTTILVLKPLAPSLDVLNHMEGSILEWIEQHHGCVVENVEQRMEAVSLLRAEANRLEVRADSAALRSVRRYSDSRGRLLLLSESLHPAGRFVYEMKLTRQRK
jgi:DNA-binding GntR family transcriptional regulator